MKKILSLLFVLIAVVTPTLAQTPTFSPNLHLTLPSDKEQEWGPLVVSDLGVLDDVIGGGTAAPWTMNTSTPIRFINSANHNTLFTVDMTGKVTALSGATFGGPVVLPADPTAPMQAATKQYVDAHASTGGGVTAAGNAQQFQIKASQGSGLAATQYGTDVTGADLLGVRNVTATGIANANPDFPLSVSQYNALATDYIRRDGNGNDANGSFADASPFHINQVINQRFACCDLAGTLNIDLELNSGYENVESNFMNYSLLALTYNGHSAVEGGGAWGYQVNANGVGDTVGTTNVLLGSGLSRGYDEGLEPHREFSAFQAQIYGGTVTLLGYDTNGNMQMQTSNQGSFGYNATVVSEQRLLVDVSQKWQAGTYNGVTLTVPGSTTVYDGNWAGDSNSFAHVVADAASNLDAKFGASTFTHLTQDVGDDAFTGTCPNVVDTGVGAGVEGDPFITDPDGNGSLTSNYCAVVASTAGFQAGDLVVIADSSFNMEYTTILTIADGTHFTANMRHPHNAGSIVSTGGGVGYGWSSPMDDRAPHTEDSVQNQQAAWDRLVYPILATLPGNQMVIWTNSDATIGNAEIKTHATINNTPQAPVVISSQTVVDGVLTSLVWNTDASLYGATLFPAGPVNTLPPPPITFSGSTPCAVNPVIGWTAKQFQSQPTYNPYIVSGGSGCPSDLVVTASATVPQPFNIYPITWIYRVEDANGSPNTGFLRTEPIVGGAWNTNDEVMEPMWWNRYTGSQTTMTGDDIVARSGHNGITSGEYFRDTQSGATLKAFINQTPAYKYFGKEANNWLPVDPGDNSMSPPVLFEAIGLYSGGLFFDMPPESGGFGGAESALGGALFSVACNTNFQSTSLIAARCNAANPIYDKFAILNIFEGGTSHGMTFNADPSTGVWSFEWGTSMEVDGDISSKTSMTSPNFLLGADNLNSPGIIWNSPYSGKTVQIVECSEQTGFANGHLCVGAVHNDMGGNSTSFAADGVLEAQTYIANGNVQAESLNIGLNTPVDGLGISIGTAQPGSVQGLYFFTAVEGGSESPDQFGGFGPFTGDPGLYAPGNAPVITCPATLQPGYPSDTTFNIYTAVINGTATGNRQLGQWLIGSCAPGGTFTDDNTSPQTFIKNSDGGPVTDTVGGGKVLAGTYTASFKGAIGFANNNLPSYQGGNTLDTAFTKDAPGVMDLGNGTQKDKSGTLNLHTLNAAEITVNGVPVGASSANAGVTTAVAPAGNSCISVQVAIDDMVAGDGLAASANGNPGSAVIATPFYISDGQAGVNVCALSGTAANSVTYTVTATATN